MIKCIKPWTNLFINNNQISFCCWYPVVIGRLNKHTSLWDFWNSQPSRQMRKHMLEGDVSEFCPQCCPFLNDGSDSFQKFARNKIHFNKNELLIYEQIKNAKTDVQSKPNELTLAIDHRCSLQCIMCMSVQKHKRYVISEGIYKLTEEMLATLRLIFITGGEPFYSERVIKFIHCFKRKKPDLKWGFITNGLDIDMDLLKKLKIDHICVSVDSVTKNIYEKIRRGSDFQKVMENLKALLNFRDKNYFFPIKIIFVVMSSNYREIPKAVDFFESLGLEIEFRMLAPYEGYPDDMDLFWHQHLWQDFRSILRQAQAKAKRKSTLNTLKILNNISYRQRFSELPHASHGASCF